MQIQSRFRGGQSSLSSPCGINPNQQEIRYLSAQASIDCVWSLENNYASYRTKQRKGAFTLAEVLITLGVIGIVSAMTLPVLINKTNDLQFRVKWKKAFSTVANAYEQAYGTEKPYIDNTNRITLANQIYYDIFSQLKTTYYCVVNSPADHECPPNSERYWEINPKCHSLLNDTITTGCNYNGAGGTAYLLDGTIIYAIGYMWDAPYFLVDVNGTQNPNVIGRDMYIILFREDKVIPGGAEGYEEMFRGCSSPLPSSQGAYDAIKKAGSGCGAEYLMK